MAIGRQGKPAAANVGKAIEGKKSGGKGVGLGAVKQGLTPKGIKGNNNKLK